MEDGERLMSILTDVFSDPTFEAVWERFKNERPVIGLAGKYSPIIKTAMLDGRLNQTIYIQDRDR